MKSENYEICRFLMLSYIESMAKKIKGVPHILSRMLLINSNFPEEDLGNGERRG